MRRILPLGDPNKSIVPELDKWIEEGNSAKKWEIHGVINELMTTRRFRHALEVITPSLFLPLIAEEEKYYLRGHIFLPV